MQHTDGRYVPAAWVQPCVVLTYRHARLFLVTTKAAALLLLLLHAHNSHKNPPCHCIFHSPPHRHKWGEEQIRLQGLRCQKAKWVGGQNLGFWSGPSPSLPPRQTVHRHRSDDFDPCGGGGANACHLSSQPFFSQTQLPGLRERRVTSFQSFLPIIYGGGVIAA